MSDNGFDWVWQADAALGRVDEQVRAAQERAEVAGRFRAEVEQVRGEARSRRGEVVVVCDVQGCLVDLRLSPAALEYSASDLARLVLRTVADARAVAGRRALGLAGDAFGPESPVVARLAAELEGRSGGR